MTKTILEKQNVVQSDGSLSCSQPWIEWRPARDDKHVFLDGEFTTADLRAIADYIEIGFLLRHAKE